MSEEEHKYPDAMKLYNSEELAKFLGISAPTVTWWLNKKDSGFPQPYAIQGRRDFPLWTFDQIKECIAIYEANKKNVNGKYSKGKKTVVIKEPEPEPEEVEHESIEVDGREGHYCPCGALYFDFDTHNKFAHRGKLSVVTYRG